jgi:GNAT superfamily N-acetyltransferase
MSISLKTLKKGTSEFYKFKKLYYKEFPSYERSPLWFLFFKSKFENVEFYSITENETWIGFIYLVTNNDLLFILYLAVDIQGKGFGSEILTKIKDLYPDHRIILTIEKPEEKAKNNEQRIKRKQFYIKNGFKESGYTVRQNKVSLEFLKYGETFILDEYNELMGRYVGKLIWPIVKIFFKKGIQKE